MAQDLTPPPAGGVENAQPYTEAEQEALSLAAELRVKVQRERATIANLRAYLLRRSSSR